MNSEVLDTGIVRLLGLGSVHVPVHIPMEREGRNDAAVLSHNELERILEFAHLGIIGANTATTPCAIPFLSDFGRFAKLEGREGSFDLL